MQCVCIQHGVAKWLAGRLKTMNLDWGTLAHIPHPQMTPAMILEAHCCNRVNRSQLKSKKCNKKWVNNTGRFDLEGLRQPRQLKVRVKVDQ